MRAPLSRNETERLAALRSYGILDTPREADFDEIVALAAEICGVPIALVSLVDSERQWFKAAVGAGDIEETPLGLSFCAHSILTPDKLLEVSDTLDDPRFAQNALVTGDPHLRFYAGAPLESPEGFALGTLCVLDREPRHLNETQRKTLRVLAKQVMTQLELRRQARALDTQREDLQATLANLEAERQQFKTLLDEIPAHVVTLRGPELVYEFANREFMRFVGRDDFLGLRAEEAWPVPDQHLALLRHILATGEPFMGQEAPVQSPPIPGREPSVGLFDFMFQPLRDADGTVSGIFVHSLDVTEKVAARQELATRAEQLRTIFDRAEDDAMILMDAERRILAWNRGAERICGWTAEEAVSVTADVIFTPEDRVKGAPDQEAATAARYGKATDERWHVRQDGTRFWGSGTMTSLHEDDGTPLGFLKVFRDATVKRRETVTLSFLRDLTDAVLHLRQSGEIISVAQRMIGEHLGASGCTYYEVNPDGETLTIVRDWAAGVGSIVGTYPLDRFGQTVASGIREGRLLAIRDVREEVPMEAGGEVILGLGIQALVCAPLWKGSASVAGVAVNSATPRDWLDDEIELVRVVADRVWSEVERARAEEQLRALNDALEVKVQERTHDLASAMKEAEAFNYAIAHDLRAPLRAIIATSRILHEEVEGRLDRSHVEMLNRQVYNATRLGVLIDQLLALSRLARVEVQRAWFDMSTLLHEIVGELKRAGMVVNGCEIDIQDGMTANGDVHLVRMALTNLLENACKFSPAGGRIEVGVETGEDGPIFRVRDQGIGFDMQYAHKLFLPFERLVLETDFPGTGVGLANVERVIRRHGGRIWAESRVGEGATFFFTLGE